MNESTESPGEERPPPLPPRPPIGSIPLEGKRPRLQSNPTTALSSIDIQTVSFPDGSRETYSTSHNRAASDSVSGTPNRKASRAGSETDDIASLMSYAPTLRANDDLQSLLGESLNSDNLAWRLQNAESDRVDFDDLEADDQLRAFADEFDEIAAVDHGNEGVY